MRTTVTFIFFSLTNQLCVGFLTNLGSRKNSILPSRPIPTSTTHLTQQLFRISTEREIIIYKTLTIFLLSLQFNLPSLADTLKTDEMKSLISVSVISEEEDARVKRKSELQRLSKDPSNSNPEDNGYLNSLQREQAKQKSRIKSKTERSRDLCESLGRGC